MHHFRAAAAAAVAAAGDDEDDAEHDQQSSQRLRVRQVQLLRFREGRERAAESGVHDPPDAQPQEGEPPQL